MFANNKSNPIIEKLSCHEIYLVSATLLVRGTSRMGLHHHQLQLQHHHSHDHWDLGPFTTKCSEDVNKHS